MRAGAGARGRTIEMKKHRRVSATLLIEITDEAHLREILDRYLGIDHVPTEVRISAVHYVRFKLTPAQAVAFTDPNVDVSIAIDHPGYRGDMPLPDDIRGSLAEDLATA